MCVANTREHIRNRICDHEILLKTCKICGRKSPAFEVERDVYHKTRQAAIPPPGFQAGALA